MKLDTKSPCASCPYRTDAPLKMWHREEFENLLAQDADEQNGRIFGCHKYRNRPAEEQHFCAGWMLDQRKRRFPSIMLRLVFMRMGVTDEMLDEFNDGGHKLYESVKAMCLANGVRKAKAKVRMPVARETKD